MAPSKNLHHNGSFRLKGWDYSSPAIYFITMVTANRDRIFGKIENGEMNLSAIGQIVRDEWEKSFIIRRELECLEYVIMPDHIHALIRINPVGADGRARLQGLYGIAYRPPRSLSSFVAGFKSSATVKINVHRNTPHKKIWQPLFWDHIVRNENELRAFMNYIRKNPTRWKG